MTPTSRKRTSGIRVRSAAVWLEIVAITVLIAANLGVVSGLFLLVTEKDLLVLGSLQLAVILAYAIVAFRRGHAIPLLIAVAVTGYLIFSTILFSELAGGKVNFNAALTYMLMLSFLPFCETRLPLGLVFRIMFAVGVGYLLIYVLLNPVIIANTVNEPRLVLETDGERERRVFLAFPWAVFILVAGIYLARDRALAGLALLALAAAAIIMSNSRMLTVLAVPVTGAALLGMFIPQSRKPLAWCFAVGYLALTLIILWGYADPDWNAYRYIAGDSSGTARFLEFQDAVKTIKGNWVFGIGIAPTTDDLHYFIRPTRPFFANDLGTAGVFFQFGLFGALLFMAYTVLCIVSVPIDDAAQTPVSRGITYATVHAGFAGFFATGLLGTSATMFGALTIGLWLKGGYFFRRERQRGSAQIDPGVATRYGYGA